jgi:drug/metabolite transporter (DMT)-like permease
MSSDRPAQNPLIGIALRIFATTCFAFMAMLVKLGHERGVATVEMAFYRFAFGLPPLLLWIAATRNFGIWRTRRPFAHLWRAAAGLTTLLLAFSALAWLPLAEATTIGFAAPLFAVLLSVLLLGERVGAHRWTAVVLGFVGMLVVMRPEARHLPVQGLALAGLAALGAGIVTITIRQVGRTEATQTTVLWFSLISILATGAAMPFVAGAHDPGTWLLLLAIGAIGGTSQICLTASLRYAPVAAVAPFDYVQLLWSVLLGWMIFAQQPLWTTWAGAAIIVASGLYTLHREHRLGRETAREAAAL